MFPSIVFQCRKNFARVISARSSRQQPWESDLLKFQQVLSWLMKHFSIMCHRRKYNRSGSLGLSSKLLYHTFLLPLESRNHKNLRFHATQFLSHSLIIHATRKHLFNYLGKFHLPNSTDSHGLPSRHKSFYHKLILESFIYRFYNDCFQSFL